jgi:hypothetical protein
MITFFLIAFGISCLVLLLAIRRANEGHEDDVGFHAGPEMADTRPQLASWPVPAIQPGAYAMPRISPWLGRSALEKEEANLRLAPKFGRLNRRSSI